MIAEDRKEDLSSIYSLLARVSALPVLKQTFLEYIKVGLTNALSLTRTVADACSVSLLDWLLSWTRRRMRRWLWR